MENQETSQPSATQAVPMAEASSGRGWNVALAIVSVTALLFVALAVFFWMRSSADQQRVVALQETVDALESVALEEADQQQEAQIEERNPSETTYLASQTEDRWGGGRCTYTYEQAKDMGLPNDLLDGSGLSVSGLSAEGVQEMIIPDIVAGAGWSEVYFEKMMTTMEQTEERLLAQCNYNNRLFIALTTHQGPLRLLEWAPDELNTRSRFAAYQPIDGMMDMVFSLFAYDDFDQPAIWTGYGDAGHLWWELHLLDKETYTSDLIERCSDSPVYDANGDWTDERIVECAREYIPDAE